MSYGKRILLLVLVDSLIVMLTIFLCSFLVLPGQGFPPIIFYSALSLLVSHHIFCFVYGLYKRMWRFASVGELISIIKAVTLSVVVTGVMQYAVLQDVHFRMLFIAWMTLILALGGVRFSWRLLTDGYHKAPKEAKRTLIYGAGAAGAELARQMKHSRDRQYYPIGFVDDDRNKLNLEVVGLPILGTREQLKELVEKYKVDTILIAIPSLKRSEMNEIVDICSKTKAKVLTIPSLADLASGKLTISDVRDVDVEDLLGREPVELDTEAIGAYLQDAVILVTGAGGSIGSEICRQVSTFQPEKVILLGHGENSIYNIYMELTNNKKFRHVEYLTEIADIQDRDKMIAIMQKYKPSVVFHAAAHKHVPLMERNPEEAVKNNVLGTKNVAEAADLAGVGTFVMISTDKAVNPTSVMGATKRLAEMIIQEMDKRSRTRFVAVRFGNVLGSRGSVIPLFKQQIANGGPVTVTHPDMQRYFMTIPEASRLVLQAGALAKGGEIFVLDMGDPVKIVDLARNLIRLSGFTEEEIPIVFTGMRPGEKLYEELLGEDEVHPEQLYPKIYIGKSKQWDMGAIVQFMEEFRSMDPETLRERLLDLAHGIKHPEPVPASASRAEFEAVKPKSRSNLTHNPLTGTSA